MTSDMTPVNVYVADTTPIRVMESDAGADAG